MTIAQNTGEAKERRDACDPKINRYSAKKKLADQLKVAKGRTKRKKKKK